MPSALRILVVEDEALVAEDLRHSLSHLGYQDTIAHVKTLSGLLPICAWCKKIRDDQSYWQSVENYIHSHSTAEFTHGMCPDCYETQLSRLPP